MSPNGLRYAFAVLLLALIWACATLPAPTWIEPPRTVRLYDLESGAVSSGSFSYSGSGQGTITIGLPNGESCSGEYFTSTGGVTAWGQIYAQVWGPGGVASGTVTDVSGMSPNEKQGTGIASCSNGTVINCEYIARQEHGTGACKDNHGKLFKLMF